MEYICEVGVSLVSEAGMFLMNAQCPHRFWSTLKLAVLGSSSDSSLSPLIEGDWSVSRLGRQKCCRPILMKSSPGNL